MLTGCCLTGGCLTGGAVVRGAVFANGAVGGLAAGSFLRFSVFCLGGFGGALGAVLFVTPVEGGAEAFGAAVSRCLFFPLSRGGVAGVVAGGTDAGGAESEGATVGAALFFDFVFLAGVAAGLAAGLTDAEALGAGERLSRRLFLPLSFGAGADGLAVGAGGALVIGLALGAVAGLLVGAGVVVAIEVVGEAVAAGLVAAFSEG